MSDEETSPGDRSVERSDHGSSSWKPYRSPEASRRGFLSFFRRHSFSITVVVAALAVGALIYFSPKRLSPESDSGGSAAVSRYSTLSVYSEPAGASVIVGADTVGVTPIENHRLPSGTYFVSVEKEDYVDRDTALTLAANQSAVYAPQLSQEEEVARAEQGGASDPPTAEDFGPDPSQSGRRGGASTEESGARGPSRVSQEQEPRSESSVEDETDSLVMGSLELRADPESTRVEVNGYDIGSTPARLDQVVAGTHEITFTRPGYETVTRRVEVRGNDTVTVEASLEAQTGHLRVLVRPWGSIYIDGQRRAENSDVWYETELQVGTYDVTARHPSLGEKGRAVEVVASDTQSVVLDMREN